MSDMGRHANGTGLRGDDGAAATPVITPITFPRLGPLSPWPLPDGTAPEEPAATTGAAATHASRFDIDGDTFIRLLAGVVVLAVAAFAAIVSYSHIFELGSHHGQDGTAARLLPLSVDGLIAAASLVMLHAARNKLPVPWLARAMLALGVGATVAANVGYGLPFGWLSAVVSAWPAVAFVGSVEMATRFVRDARHVAAGEAPDVAAGEDVASDISSDKEDEAVSPEPVAEQQAERDTEPPPAPRRVTRKARTGSDKARDIIKRNPGLAKDVVAKRAGVTVRTVERVISDMEGPAK